MNRAREINETPQKQAETAKKTQEEPLAQKPKYTGEGNEIPPKRRKPLKKRRNKKIPANEKPSNVTHATSEGARRTTSNSRSHIE